jgi:hypothetical protein
MKFRVTTFQAYLVRQVIEFIVDNCHHENSQVLRNNLEILKTLVEVWRPSVEVPTR